MVINSIDCSYRTYEYNYVTMGALRCKPTNPTQYGLQIAEHDLEAAEAS